MKTTTLATLAALMGTCAFAAAEGPARRPNGPDRQIPPRILEKFDKDQDGKLSEDERKAAREAMETRHKAILEKFDANKNGKLDPDEIKAAREAGGLDGLHRPKGGAAPTAE